MRGLAAAGALALLCACASDEAKIDYKSAGSLPPLEVPPDLTSPTRDNRYVVPESGRSATLSGYQAERGGQPRPGASGLLPDFEGMKIERAGTQRWLVVQEPPERLWPMIKDFWQESGFLIKMELPEAGVMETDWAENRAKIPTDIVREFLGRVIDQLFSTSERDKYRTRLDRTQDGKGTEVYISHRGMQEVYTTPRDPQNQAPGLTAWQPRPSDPELEVEFLRKLMVRLGARDEKAKLAAAVQPQLKAEIRKANDGTELLQVFEPFDRAWRRVGLALDRVGFTVEDRDRQKGLYFVRYADPESDMKEKDKGMIDRLLSFASNESKVKAEQYRVQVTQIPNGSEVHVLNKEGASERSKTAQRILALLHEQLK